MKITKQELIDLGACISGLKRFIKQTNGTDEVVEVASLVGGENTYSDLLWLAGKKLPQERITRFACDCALINIELIKPYTDKYDMIVGFLTNPTADAADDGYDAADDAGDDAYDAYDDSDDSTRAAADAADAARSAAYVATRAATDTVGYGAAAGAAYHAAHACGNHGEVNKLLRELFA